MSDEIENSSESEHKTIVPIDNLHRLEEENLPLQVRKLIDDAPNIDEAAFAVIDLLHEDPRDMQEWSPYQQNVYLVALAGSVAQEDSLIQTVRSDGPWLTHVYNALAEINAQTATAILPGAAFPADETIGRQIFEKLTKDQQVKLVSLQSAFQDYVVDQMPSDMAAYISATLDRWV